MGTGQVGVATESVAGSTNHVARPTSHVAASTEDVGSATSRVGAATKAVLVFIVARKGKFTQWEQNYLNKYALVASKLASWT